MLPLFYYCVQSAPNLVRLLRIWYETNLFVKKCKVIQIQDGGCRHLEFRKTCHFSTIGPILTKFDVNLANSIWNTTVMSKTQIHPTSRWRLPPSLISKTVAISLLLDRSPPNLMGILQIQFKTQPLWRKYSFNNIQVVACRRFKFRQ